MRDFLAGGLLKCIRVIIGKFRRYGIRLALNDCVFKVTGPDAYSRKSSSFRTRQFTEFLGRKGLCKLQPTALSASLFQSNLVIGTQSDDFRFRRAGEFCCRRTTTPWLRERSREPRDRIDLDPRCDAETQKRRRTAYQIRPKPSELWRADTVCSLLGDLTNRKKTVAQNG